MHISCKLTSTILRFLEDRDEDATSLLESTEAPEEFLREPSYWLKAEELEHFLGELVKRSWSSAPSSQLLTIIAQSCVESRSWGVLDSVLRMMNSPAEVFTQPERFLSYFVAPAPPVAAVERSEFGIAFDLPLSAEQYPLLTKLMGASLEMIPVFMGLPPAQCTWDGIRLTLSWDQNQKNIFEPVETERQFSPVLARDLLQNLQPSISPGISPSVSQTIPQAVVPPPRTSEVMQSQMLGLGDLENSHHRESLQGQMMASRGDLAALPAQVDIEHLRHQIARLSDYMIRAQQIITLMASAKKIAPEVKEAMRRVDWPLVQQQFPVTVEECYQIFRQSKALKAQGTAVKSHETSHERQRNASTIIPAAAVPSADKRISFKEDPRV